MRVWVNAASASLGGAATYLRELLAEFRAQPRDATLVVWVPAGTDTLLGPSTDALKFSVLPKAPGALRRFWMDQVSQRRWLMRERIDVAFSSANLGMLSSPVPQLLLVRNALPFSVLYRQRILPQKTWRLRQSENARKVLAHLSASRAHRVMVPSETMRQELLSAVPSCERRTVVNLYGVRSERFGLDSGARPMPMLPTAVFTGLYSEHKNLGTLFEAMGLLAQRGQRVLLKTPADPRLENIHNPIRHRDALLLDSLRHQGLAASTGVLKAEGLAKLYAEASLFVYPSVVESFGHPLAEAMAAQRPIVAADVPINRELCQDAAVYFSPFDPSSCAEAMTRVLNDATLRDRLIQNGTRRVATLTWASHWERLHGILKQTAAGVL
ncbi:MAG: glycosyltransferase family 4 protein [Myxococcaceae bacterium]